MEKMNSKCIMLTTLILIGMPRWSVAQNNRVTTDVVERYFLKLDAAEKWAKPHLQWLISHNASSSGKAFKFLLSNRKKIGQVLEDEQAISRHIHYIIAKEEIDPFLSFSDSLVVANPDWEKIQKRITKKYAKPDADKTILDAQLRWSEYKKDTPALIRYNVAKIKKYGIDTVGFGKPNLNNMVYYLIFQHCNDSIILGNAIEWMETLVNIEPDNAAFIDTYANILYKAGRRQEAITWENKAMLLAPEDQEIKQAWEKMQRGEPTWTLPK